MLEFLTVAVVVALLVLALVVTATSLALRRLLRSRLVVTGTHAVADGLLGLSACRLRSTPNRGAALVALRISRGHRLLRNRVTAAQRAGVHLGDVPAVLPRLEAEGRRMRTALGTLVGSSAAGQELLTQAERHLQTLASLGEAVAGAVRASTADATVAVEAEEAAAGLRLHAAAYAELLGMGNARAGQRPVEAA